MLFTDTRLCFNPKQLLSRHLVGFYDQVYRKIFEKFSHVERLECMRLNLWHFSEVRIFHGKTCSLNDLRRTAFIIIVSCILLDLEFVGRSILLVDINR